MFAGEKPNKGPPFQGAVVADRTAEHRITGLEGVEDRSLCDRAINFEQHLIADAGEGAEVEGDNHSDHYTSLKTRADAEAGVFLIHDKVSLPMRLYRR